MKHRAKVDPHTRVLRKTKKSEDGCWVFTGAKNAQGYGSVRVRVGDRWVVRKAHRVVYEAMVGPIPDGALLRHKCDNRPCVRPDHLTPGDQEQNMQEMMERGRGRGQFRRRSIVEAIDACIPDPDECPF
jgi:hypothetical protein